MTIRNRKNGMEMREMNQSNDDADEIAVPLGELGQLRGLVTHR